MPTGTPFLRISNRTWFFPSNKILSKPDEPNPSRTVAIRLSETDGFYLRGNLSGVWLVVSPPLTHWREIKGWRTKIAPPFQQHVELGSQKKPPAVCFARVFGTKENDMSPVFFWHEQNLEASTSEQFLDVESCGPCGFYPVFTKSCQQSFWEWWEHCNSCVLNGLLHSRPSPKHHDNVRLCWNLFLPHRTGTQKLGKLSLRKSMAIFCILFALYSYIVLTIGEPWNSSRICTKMFWACLNFCEVEERPIK